MAGEDDGHVFFSLVSLLAQHVGLWDGLWAYFYWTSIAER